MAERVTLDLLTWDVTPAHESVAACTEAVIAAVRESWDSGADLVLLPEFMWMMLEPLVVVKPSGDTGVDSATASTPDKLKLELQLKSVAAVFWGEEWPRLTRELARPDKAVVLGTCPFWEEHRGQFRNRAPVLRGLDALHQDKLHLTPWEKAFSPGEAVRLFGFRGLTIAVLICLDIEVPELSVLLRGRGVDLILCPSATETVLGVERVDRCASARAVELGCHVGVSHLLGKSSSELIDVNTGRVAVYHPSQVPFAGGPRWQEGAIETGGLHRLRVGIEPVSLRRMRRRLEETNPALLEIPKGADYLPVTLE